MKKMISIAGLMVFGLSGVSWYALQNNAIDQVTTNPKQQGLANNTSPIGSVSLHSSVNDNAANFQTLEQRMTALQNDVDKIIAQLQQLKNEEKPKAVSEADLFAQESTDENEIRAQTISSFNQRIAAEEIDKKWSQWAESEINARLTSETFAGITVVNNECYSTLCRIELNYEGAENLDKGLNALSYAASWDAEGYFYIDENEPERLVAFLAREGEVLQP